MGMLKFLLHSALGLLCFLALLTALAGAALLSAPRPDDIKKCIVAKMHSVPLCPTDKAYVRIKNISPYIRHAVIVSEDAGFYGHNGLDFHELRMSFEENLKAGRFARGGSTITQQLAKNVYLSGDKSLVRKAREALIALQLEKTLTKDEILEKYLNVVEFGPDIYGVAKATQYYFGKAPADVDVLEGAWLAFVLPNPKQYSQSFRKRELTRFARSRLQVIVRRMARYKRITADAEAQALERLAHMFKPIEDPNEDPIDPALEAELQEATPDEMPEEAPESGLFEESSETAEPPLGDALAEPGF